MVDQESLRARIEALTVRQAARVLLAAKMKKELDAVIEVRQREIDNLKSQLIRAVK